MQGPLKVNGDSIRVLRVVRGLSRRQLGDKANIKPHRVFQIEHKTGREAGEEEIARLLGALTSE